MTLEEISILTGSSITTISRVINDKPGVSKEKRDSIKKFLIENGFYKKGIFTDISKQIAVVIPDLQNPFFGEIVKRISETLRESDFQIIVFDTDENFSLEEKAIETILKTNVQGVIICVTDTINSLKNLEKLEKLKIPFVIFDRELDFYQDGVFLDDFKAGYLATQFLIDKGHKNISILLGPLGVKNVKNRYSGYLYALKSNNIEINEKLVFEGNFKLDSGFNFMKYIDEENLNTSAVVSCNNFMTLGILKYKNSSNKNTIKNLELIGIDNPDYFDILNLKINCISRPISQMGILAANLMLKKISNSVDYTEKIIIQPKLEIKNF